MHIRKSLRTGLTGVCCLATLLAAAASNAQITGVTALKNAGNTADVFVGPPAFTSYEIESAVSVTAATATSFSTRYTGLVTIDPGILGPGPGGVMLLASDYDLNFSVTAPGAYRLTVTTQRKGELTLIEDNIFVGGHYADMTALSGTATGGALASGTLNLPDPGRVDDIAFVFDPIFRAFNQNATATIFAVSDGSPVAHTLRFTWTQEAGSPSQGDEAAVRLGGTSNDASETAGDYPGANARVQADDGHFVTVTLESLCGNGAIDGGPGGYLEACDEGGANGTAGSCCNGDCTLRTAGTVCRSPAGGCDSTEVCDGVYGGCPLDSAMGAFTLCRAAAGPCDLEERCDGISVACPPDAKSTATCRNAAGVCDVAEQCDGFNDTCPPDQKSTAVCRAATGQCDVSEVCDGFNPSCPADQVVPNGTACEDGDACTTGETCGGGVCAGGSGGCGPCETCQVGGCAPGPKLGCRVPISAGRAKLTMKDSPTDTSDQISWKWTQGAATPIADFGDPLATTGYTLCVFDQNGAHPVLAPELPAGGVCATSACWKVIGTRGFKYKDKDRTPNGADKMTLLSGLAGKAKITFKGKGTNLALPGLGLTTPVRVQLQGTNGQCWESTFSTATQNTATVFKAKSD